MGNAVVCSSGGEAKNECNKLPQSGQLTERPRQPTTPTPYFDHEKGVRCDTTFVDGYERIGFSPQHQRSTRFSSTGVSPAELCSLSGSTPTTSELERQSVTPQMEWSQSLSYTVSLTSVDSQHDYIVDLDALSSHLRSDRSTEVQHADRSTESSTRSSHVTLSDSGLELTPEIYFTDHAEYAAVTERQAPRLDPTTLISPPPLTESPVKSPHWDDVLLLLIPTPTPSDLKPAGTPAVTAESPAAPAAPSPCAPFSRNAKTTTRKPPDDGRSPDSKCASSRRESTDTLREPMRGPPAPPMHLLEQSLPFSQVRALHAVKEVKPTRSPTSSAASKGTKGHSPEVLPRQCITNSSATFALTPPPHVAVMAASAKAAAKTADTSNSSITGSPGSQPPALSWSLIRRRKNRLSGGKTIVPEATNDCWAAGRSTSPRHTPAAHEVGHTSAAGTLLSGTSGLPSSPAADGLRTRGRGNQDLASLATGTGTSASSTTMKPTPKHTNRCTSRGAVNDGVRESLVASQLPRSTMSDDDDGVLPLKFAVCGVATVPSPQRTEWQTATAQTTANHSPALTSTVVTSTEAAPHSPKRSALTLTEGGGLPDAIAKAHLQASNPSAKAQSLLHADNCMGGRKREKLQNSLSSASLHSPPSPRQGGSGEQRCRRFHNESESPGERMARSSHDDQNSPRHSNMGDSMPNLGVSCRVDSILKKTSSYRSRNGSLVERTLPAVGSVSFLLCKQEAALALVSRQGVSKAVSRHAKPLHKENLQLLEDL
ncbi:hypothetical protein, unknown function [Leishmania braziliensis MHOM/BR/75/M2904]|uniref:Uncharacterized protein n=1 Tax=Leishmania braziliensis TaxID=5660 RepID=A4HJK1_LEIBR|nr:hypothetical protein, unknown function [Leishmania braziliensis MHOM/BR/75/M2904]CAJ2478038.1 unnamed protein product [Leishmania braziliensis]CAM42665.2 hypothetical protein, unknown function [Leishmania braziliensis MHOM/BR/75/M2904]